MSGQNKKRYGLVFLAMVLTALVTGILGRSEWLLNNVGDCFATLAFVDQEETAEQTITPFYSQVDDTYYLFLPSYSTMSNVSIYFEGAEEAVFKKDKMSQKLERGADIQNLELDTLYELTFIGGGYNEDKAVGFKIMHSANLPALFIETESGTMEEVDADKDYQEKGRYALVDSDGTLLYMDKLKHITGRGNSTWGYQKKSYGIKLKSAVDMLGMGSADAWVLLSNVEDTSYLRNKITYDMAIAAGMTGSPDSRYIDLYINHEYHGMYLLCEKIEVGENRIPMADLDYENEKLNKGIEQLERVVTAFSKCVRLGTNPKDISGGYLLERDVPSKYDEEVSGFQTAALGDRYTIKSPAYASVEETEYIKNLVDGMERAVLAEDGIDAETGKSYTEYIDLKSFAQKYVIEELCKNNGGGATSSWFYKPQDAVSTRLFAGPVWDYDKAYARLSGYNASTRDLCYVTQRYEGTTLFWHLNQHPEFQAAVKECYADFFSDYIEEVLEDKITEYASQIYVSADMDTVRWKELYGNIQDFGQRAYVIKEFLTERKAFLDEVWLQDAEVETVHFVAPEWDRDTYMSVIKGECLQAIPDLEEDNPNLLFGGWYTEDGEEFDISRPIYEDVTYYAKGVPDEQ